MISNRSIQIEGNISAVLDDREGELSYGMAIDPAKIYSVIEWFGYDPSFVLQPATLFHIVHNKQTKHNGESIRTVNPITRKELHVIKLNQANIHPGNEDFTVVEELFHQIQTQYHPELEDQKIRRTKLIRLLSPIIGLAVSGLGYSCIREISSQPENPYLYLGVFMSLLIATYTFGSTFNNQLEYDFSPKERGPLGAKRATKDFLRNAPEYARNSIYWTQEPGIWKV